MPPGEGAFYSTRYVVTISLVHIVTRSTSFPPSFRARIFSQSSQEVRESERAPRLVGFMTSANVSDVKALAFRVRRVTAPRGVRRRSDWGRDGGGRERVRRYVSLARDEPTAVASLVVVSPRGSAPC